MQSKRRSPSSTPSSGTKTGRIIHPSVKHSRNENFLATLDDEGFWRLGAGGWLIHVHEMRDRKGHLTGFEGMFRQYTPEAVISAASPCDCKIPHKIKRKYDFLYNMMRGDMGWW